MNSKVARRIEFNSSNCKGCRLCQLRCSYRQDQTFSLSKAMLRISWNEQQLRYECFFNDGCDKCGSCTRYCLYDALVVSEGPSLNND